MSLALRASFGLRPSLIVIGAARVIRPAAVIRFAVIYGHWRCARHLWSLIVIGAARVIWPAAVIRFAVINDHLMTT